jgi:hypothetical protein
MCVNWTFSSQFKHLRHLTYRVLYWRQYLHITTIYAAYRRAYKHLNSKLTAVCNCYSTVRTSQLQTSTYVTFLEEKYMCISHWQWHCTSTSRKRMCLCTPMTAKCRLHIAIILCTTGHDTGCTVTHFKRLDLFYFCPRFTTKFRKYTDDIMTR